MRAAGTSREKTGKGELTRQRIIQQAAPMFNQRGYAGCSVQDVMQSTGLEKGGIYRHFRSKEDLAAAAFEYAYGETTRRRRDGLVGIDSAIGKLQQMVKQFAEVPSAIPGGCPLLNTAIDADDGNVVLRGLAAKALRSWKKSICRIVEDGIRSGEFKRKTEAEQIANIIIATLEGALMICRLEGDRAALRAARSSLEAMLASLLRVPAGKVPQ